jgi:hypothetical protein
MSHKDTPYPQSLVPQSERSYLYRFFAQVVKSIWHVTVTQQLITVFPVGIITLLVHLNSGLIITDSFWAYLRAAIQIILITYGLIILINVFRAPFILDGEQRKRIAGLQATVLAVERRQLEGSNLATTREDKQVTVTDAERRLFAKKDEPLPPPDQSPTTSERRIACLRTDIIPTV